MSCLIVGADPLAVDSEPPQKVCYQTKVTTAYVCMHNIQIIYMYYTYKVTVGYKINCEATDLMMREFSKQLH